MVCESSRPGTAPDPGILVSGHDLPAHGYPKLKAINCGVNDLPLSMIISWYEQKAVAILLTLLHLGIKNIKLDPGLPAFVTPNVLGVLVEKFAIAPIGTAKGDLKAIMGQKAA